MQMIAIPTPRDILALRAGELVWVSAVDSCGGVGALAQDALFADPDTVGAYTARTALLEVLCAGAQPLFATLAAGNAPDVTERLLQGARTVLGQGLPLAISSEKNIPTAMTALGITVTGACPVAQLRLGGVRAGDDLICIGRPLVGAQVLTQARRIPQAAQIAALLREDAVRAMLPVGSRGIAAEAAVLARESCLHVQLAADAPLDLYASAGPSACVLAAVRPGYAPALGAVPVTWAGRFTHPG